VAGDDLSEGRPIRRGAYPELTWTSVLVGYGLGIMIAVSIGYASLILGFSIEGSAGLMFTVPALFILGVEEFNSVLMVFSCIAGGILGIAFIIPLRKQMIDFERLTYPGGVAVATILKSPGAGVHKAMLLVSGIALSGGVHLASKFTGFEDWNLGAQLGLPEYMNGVWYVSLMTIGVGFISGKGGFSFVIGGFVCYWFLAPILSAMGHLPGAEALAAEGQTIAGYLRIALFRPVGIGMLIGGAVAGIVLALPLIVSAIRSMRSSSKMKSGLSKDEMPIQFLYVGIAGAAILLFIVALKSVKEMDWITAGIMAVLGTLWIWVAGVILSECIGRTNWSPLSGMTLIAVTILIIISKGIDEGGTGAIIASIMVGAAACVAMSQATDLMLDLKTGYLVGASPKKQQTGQFLATWLGPIVVLVLIFVLHKSYTLGSDRLPAPQGKVLASMIEGILGGDVPKFKYMAGAGLGVVLSASGIGGLGILVGLGFYLPFNVVLTYSIGTILRLSVDKWKGARFSEEVGIPVAAGLIVGEAMIGVGFALYYFISAALGR